MSINRISPITFPRVPVNNITPFTYRDGWTFLELIEKFREYINSGLVPQVNEAIESLIENYSDALNELIAQGNLKLEELEDLYNSFVDAVASENNEFKNLIQSLVDSINNRSGMIDVRHVDLSLAGSNVVNIDPTWPNNLPIVYRFTQGSAPVDLVVGNGVASVPHINRLPGAVTEVTFIPNGSGEFEGVVYAPDNSVTVSARSYGAQGNGVVDDSVAIQRAVDACPDGGVVKVEPGTYLFDSQGVVVQGKTITIDLTGATIVHKFPGTALRFVGEYEGITPVTSMTVVTTTDEENTTGALQLTLPTAVSWKRGDVVKLVADDILPGSRSDIGGTAPSSAYRVGQHFTVKDVSGNVVTLMGVLRDPMTVNLRVGRMVERSGHVINGTFVVHESFTDDNRTAIALSMSTLIGPTITGTRFTRAGAQAIGMNSCYTYTIDGVIVDWSRNAPGLGVYGYAIADTNSEYGKIVNSHFNQVRHAFTSGGGPVVPLSAFGYYGRCFGTVVDGCTVESPLGSGFDTHLDAQGVRFSNCDVYNASSGFSLRGRNHVVSNCTVNNATFGVFISDESLGDSSGHIIEGLTTRDCANGIQVSIRQVGHKNAGVRDTRTMTFRDLTFLRLTGTALHVAQGTVTVSNMYASWSGPVPFKSVQLVAAFVRLSGVKFDLHDTTGTGLEVFGCNGTVACRLTVDDIEIDGWAAVAERVRYLVGTDSATLHQIRVRNASIPYVPYNGITPFDSVAGYVEWFLNRGTNLDNSEYVRYGNTELTDATKLGVINRTRQNEFTLDANVTTALTLANLPNAGKLGQSLTIINSGTASMTIANGTVPRVKTKTGANVVLAAGDSMRLVFNSSSLWVQV